MQYDQTTIADTYDAARSYRPEVLRQWLDLIAAHGPRHPELIVDLGCGTGRFTLPLAERFRTRVIGIDPSEKMLAIAGKQLSNAGIAFCKASAEKIPLEDGCADMVFMSMVLHHITDRAQAAQECRRVLRKGGRVCLRNSTRESKFPQARFFPGISALLETELPSRDEVVTIFERVGLRLSAYQCISHTLAMGWNELADKLAMRADSFLARLRDTEFEAGMAALRAHANTSADVRPIVEDIHFFAFEHGSAEIAGGQCDLA